MSLTFHHLLCVTVLFGLYQCSRQQPAPVQVTFIVAAPFDGELVIANVAGASNPVMTKSGLNMKIDPAAENSYDARRWPLAFTSQGTFATGQPIQMVVKNVRAEYSLSVTALDGRGNMHLKMVRLPGEQEPDKGTQIDSW